MTRICSGTEGGDYVVNSTDGLYLDGGGNVTDFKLLIEPPHLWHLIPRTCVINYFNYTKAGSYHGNRAVSESSSLASGW